VRRERGAPGGASGSHIPLVRMSPEQHRTLHELQERHPETVIDVDRGPGGSIEAKLTEQGDPAERYIFGRDAEEMLEKVTEAIEPAEPDSG
jgi:hypothetical protein